MHTLQTRAGRLQCTACRAAFADTESAAKSTYACPRIPLPHGLYRREHVVYPSWGREEGIDALCDESSCPCMTHACDCDVCAGVVDAPGLNVLRDDHEEGSGILTRFDSALVT